jgi:hypothetical protein
MPLQSMYVDAHNMKIKIGKKNERMKNNNKFNKRSVSCMVTRYNQQHSLL